MHRYYTCIACEVVKQHAAEDICLVNKIPSATLLKLFDSSELLQTHQKKAFVIYLDRYNILAKRFQKNFLMNFPVNFHLLISLIAAEN